MAMGLNPKQASWDVMDWSQGLLKDGGLAMPKPAGQKQQMPPLKCPRCDSTNTKFCYYNNYSRSQPRYHCKACRRHWTEGGTLRNVPVGGGRRSKRQKTTHNTTATPNTETVNNPMTHQQQQQLMLPFNGFNNILRQVMVPFNGFNSKLVGSNHSLQPLPSQLTDTKPVDANSSDFYSSYHNYMRQQPITGEEGLASTEPAATGDVGSSPGYWSGWDYDLTGLVDPELRQPPDDPKVLDEERRR